jgi:hypothetical protein
VDRVSGELGLSQPANVIGSGMNQTNQMLALVQSLGEDLVLEFEWQRLVRIHVFTTTAATSLSGTTVSGASTITGLSSTSALSVGMVITGTSASGIAPYAEIATIDSATQVTMNTPATASATSTLTFALQDYAMPSGYNRMVSDTNWDRTNHWRNLGTTSSQQWQTLQGGVISVGPRERFRVFNDKLRFFPAPTAAYNEAFEYVSNYWVIASGGTAGTKDTPTLDTDTFVFGDALMRAGLKYYFLNAKKLECDDELQKYNDLLSVAKATDVPLTVQSLSPTIYPELIGPWSVPDGSWRL